MPNIIPKLGLINIRDAELIYYAQDKIDKINNSPAFAAVVPSTAVVETKKQEYDDALVAADNGTRAATAVKDQKRKELEELLSRQAQDCARIASGNMALYLTTGYEAKSIKGHPAGELPQVTGLALNYGNNSGELQAGWDFIRKAANYTVWVYSDIHNPEGSLVKEYIVGKIGKKKTTLNDLPPGQIIFVRVRANGGSRGVGAWSDVAEKRVP